MVAAEERKMASRKEAVKEQEALYKKNQGNQQAKGHENKIKIVSESRSAGKVDRKEGEEKED
jgi:hypothetical protein